MTQTQELMITYVALRVMVSSGLVRTGPGAQPGYEEVQEKLVQLWPQYASKYSDYRVKATGLDFLVRGRGAEGRGPDDGSRPSHKSRLVLRDQVLLIERGP